MIIVRLTGIDCGVMVKDPVPDLLQEGQEGYGIQLRLADWEQFSRMIVIARRLSDWYESSVCTAHETGRHRATY